MWFADRLAALIERDDSVQRDGDLVWLGEERVAVWFPLGSIATEGAAGADRWRRQRRIPPKDWPPWM